MQKLHVLVLSLFFLFFTSLARAENLRISDAYAYEAPPVAKVMAAYMTIHNDSEKDRFLTGAISPGFLRIEIHAMEMKDGMMHMVEQKRLRIPAKSSVTLEPGGLHLMLIKPRKVFKAGDTINFRLFFNDKHRHDLTTPDRYDLTIPVRKSGE